MDKSKEHVGNIEKQLSQWGSKIDEFVAQAEVAGEEARTDYRAQVVELKAKHKEAQAKLHEFKSASGEKWETFKTGVESVLSELEAAFKKMTKN